MFPNLAHFQPVVVNSEPLELVRNFEILWLNNMKAYVLYSKKASSRLHLLKHSSSVAPQKLLRYTVLHHSWVLSVLAFE